MIRRAAILSLALLLGACAVKTPQAPVPQSGPASIPSAPPRGEPSQYINMAATGLQAAFGKPAFVRKDGATEMWRYDIGTCRAFFFFTGNQVGHVETIPRGADNAADPACLIALRKAS